MYLIQNSNELVFRYFKMSMLRIIVLSKVVLKNISNDFFLEIISEDRHLNKLILIITIFKKLKLTISPKSPNPLSRNYYSYSTYIKLITQKQLVQILILIC